MTAYETYTKQLEKMNNQTRFADLKDGQKFTVVTMPTSVYVKECGWLATNLTLQARFGSIIRPETHHHFEAVTVVA